MESIWQDIRYGCRSLIKSPIFSLTIILSLALAIGANTAVFSILNEVLLKPLPFKDSERIVHLNENFNIINYETFPAFLDALQQGPFFEEIAGFKWMVFDINDGNAPIMVTGVWVAGRLLHVLGIEPALGRFFLKEEDKFGAPLVTMISYDFWQKHFTGDPNVIGRAMRIDGRRAEIVGVLPKVYGSYFYGEDLWMPMSALHEDKPQKGRTVFLIAKLRRGKTIEQTQHWIRTITRSLGAQEDHRVELQTLRESKYENEKYAVPIILLWSGVAAFIFLIACANVVSLLLARSASREKELAIRTSLGASRFELVRLQLIESLFLSVVGGLVGFILALMAKDFFSDVTHFSSYIPTSRGYFVTASVNWIVILFTGVISVIAGLVSGILPAVLSSKKDLNSSLKAGGQYSSAHVPRRRAGNILVISEIALAVILVVGAGLLIKGLILLMNIDPGIQTTNVLAMDVPLPSYKYPDLVRRKQFYDDLLERIRNIPGVELASTVLYLPSTGLGQSEVAFEDSPSKWKEINSQIVGSDYFRLMRIGVVMGRVFENSDRVNSLPVAVVSESFAKLYFPRQSALGRRLKFYGDTFGQEHEIIGVVKDVYQSGLDQQKHPLVYLSYSQTPIYNISIVVRSRIPSGTMSTLLRKQVWEMDLYQPIGSVETMEEVLSKSLADRRLKTWLLSVLGITGLLISMIGVYGLISYSVGCRTHEIGIRMAIGADQGDVLKMITKQGAVLALVGIALGLIGAVWLTRFLSAMVYGISPTDPETFIAVCVLFLAAVMLASFIPARRAAKIDPMIALRHE